MLEGVGWFYFTGAWYTGIMLGKLNFIAPLLMAGAAATAIAAAPIAAADGYAGGISSPYIADQPGGGGCVNGAGCGGGDGNNGGGCVPGVGCGGGNPGGGSGCVLGVGCGGGSLAGGGGCVAGVGCGGYRP